MFYSVKAAAGGLDRFRTVTHPTPVPQANVAYWRARQHCASKGTSPSMVQSEPARLGESSQPPLLRVERVTKSFPGVLALQDVSLEVHPGADRKSTRLNSSHLVISYAVFCLKKKTHSHLRHTYHAHPH